MLSTNSLTWSRPLVVNDPKERSRCKRWRFRWLPGGRPMPCPLYPNQMLTKTHAIQCLNMHNRLQISSTMKEPLSFLLDLLPIKLPCSSHAVAPWILRWSTIYSILFEPDHLYHHRHLCQTSTWSAPSKLALKVLRMLLCSKYYSIDLFYPWLRRVFSVSLYFTHIELVRANRCAKHLALRWTFVNE